MLIPGSSLALPVVFFDDFVTGVLEDGHKFSTSANKGDWYAAQTSGGVCQVQDDAPGGVLQIDGASTTNNGYLSIQLNGDAYKIAAGKDIYFACRIKTVEPTALDMFMGLSTEDTDILGSGTNVVGFGTYDGSTDLLDGGTGDIYAITRNATTGNYATSTTTITDTTVNLATTWTELAILITSNTRVEFFVNGALKVTHTTNIPTGDELTLSMAGYENGGSVPQLKVDWILCVQER